MQRLVTVCSCFALGDLLACAESGHLRLSDRADGDGNGRTLTQRAVFFELPHFPGDSQMIGPFRTGAGLAQSRRGPFIGLIGLVASLRGRPRRRQRDGQARRVRRRG